MHSQRPDIVSSRETRVLAGSHPLGGSGSDSPGPSCRSYRPRLRLSERCSAAAPHTSNPAPIIVTDRATRAMPVSSVRINEPTRVTALASPWLSVHCLPELNSRILTTLGCSALGSLGSTEAFWRPLAVSLIRECVNPQRSRPTCHVPADVVTWPSCPK